MMHATSRPRREHLGRVQPRSSAAGYSLLELLVVLALISVLFSGVGVALNLLARLEAQLRAELPAADLLGRLSLVLRRDAHEALQWTLSADTADPAGPKPSGTESSESAPGAPTGGNLRLKSPSGGQVVYQRRGTTIVREEFQNGQRIHREIFRMGQSSVMEWELASEPVDMVILSVQQPLGRIPGAPGGWKRIRIAAALGLRKLGN